MNGKAMMAGTTTPHILSGAELVGSYIVVITDGRQVVASFHLAQFADVAGDSEILYPIDPIMYTRRYVLSMIPQPRQFVRSRVAILEDRPF